MTIVTALMALFADHVMGVVASTRRSYLVEFNEYLDGRALKPRPSRRASI
jgi:hypothetical protein